MPLIQTRGAASAQGFGEFAQVTAVNYIEDVFSCFLYTGTGALQTITNGIDLSTKGGLVWLKSRSTTYDHYLQDTTRGIQNTLTSIDTSAQSVANDIVNSVSTTGFVVQSYSGGNNSGSTYVSWTFRKQPKFFDVVTYSGNSGVQNIAHNLGSVPGCIIVKSTSTLSQWNVYHQSLGNTQAVKLQSTAAATSSVNFWDNTNPTSTQFTLGSSFNTSGETYIAYLFAHDAGGFGLTGTDNVISCGTFTTDGSGDATVSLGYEPQWVLEKASSAAQQWNLLDVMRGMSNTDGNLLVPNSSAAESAVGGAYIVPTATGFTVTTHAASRTYIYIAIRRGPMKVPTVGTSVFSPNAHIGTEPTRKVITAGFPVDLSIQAYRNLGGSAYFGFTDRLRGGTQYLVPYNTSAEGTSASPDNFLFDSNTTLTSGQGAWNNTNANGLSFNLLRRAPSFFDEVCYTGDGTDPQTVAHNLGVAPELMIFKARAVAAGWRVWGGNMAITEYLALSETSAVVTGSTFFGSTLPTSTSFYVGSGLSVAARTIVAYLFATCPGVSKVGSYTGNGTTQTINCGFTGGARFVLIKRTDSTGDWYVYDTARGMTVLTDPYLWLNSTAAEVATLGSVTTVATGFALDSAIVAAINVNAGTYIFLAIA